jgi:hypothetical protein
MTSRAIEGEAKIMVTNVCVGVVAEDNAKQILASMMKINQRALKESHQKMSW